LRSRYSATALVYMLISRSLSIIGSTSYNILLPDDSGSFQITEDPEFLSCTYPFNEIRFALFSGHSFTLHLLGAPVCEKEKRNSELRDTIPVQKRGYE
jgi:hypothetical protein